MRCADYCTSGSEKYRNGSHLIVLMCGPQDSRVPARQPASPYFVKRNANVQHLAPSERIHLTVVLPSLVRPKKVTIRTLQAAIEASHQVPPSPTVCELLSGETREETSSSADRPHVAPARCSSGFSGSCLLPGTGSRCHLNDQGAQTA